MSLFNGLFSHGHSYEKCNAEALPVSKISSASAVRRSKDGNEWVNVIFTLTNGSKRECKISKTSEFVDANTGDELPVSGEIFQLVNENGEVTKNIYWEEA